MAPRRKINVMFYKPPDTDPWLNRLVSWADPPYSHAELCFEDGTAASIFNGETVFLQKRSFANPNYSIVTLTVEQESYAAMLAFCTRSSKERVGFDRLGMFTSLLPLQIAWKRSDVTFCSRFVTEALQVGGVSAVAGLNSMHVTPSRLHAKLTATKTHMLDTVAGRYHRVDL
eukprot:1843677-Rhodomonas_salina.2